MKLASLALSALPLPAGGGAPTEFRILRAGVNKTEKGDFVFDEQAALSVMEAYRSKGIDKPQIDYEHQSMQPPPGGGDAAKPAAGWFKPAVRAGELWATEVAWTARAMSMIAPAAGAPEYRFISPILRFDEESMRIRSIKNLALTNDPAMDEIGPLAAATAVANPKETEMPCEACTALSAKLKAKEEECTSLTARLSAYEDKDKDKDAAMTSLTTIRSEICALTGQTTEAAAIGALKGLKAAHEELTALKTKIAGEKAAALSSEFNKKLDAVVASGGVTPGGDTEMRHRGYWEKIVTTKGTQEALEQLTAAEPFLSKLPIVKPNGAGTAEPAAGTVTLTAAELEIARRTGSDVEKLKKFKAGKLPGASAP